MPPKSKKQKRYMEAIAHGWKPTYGGPGPSKAVAEEILHGGKRKRKRNESKRRRRMVHDRDERREERRKRRHNPGY